MPDLLDRVALAQKMREEITAQEDAIIFSILDSLGKKVIVYCA